jgi:superfamily I DNA/RNA helicase
VFQRLRAAGIPTKSYYAEASLDTMEAQERFALLKLFLDNEDRVALRWLLGKGHPHWRTNPYRRILAHVRGSDDSPWGTLVRLTEGTLNIAHTGTLIERFEEIRNELANLAAAADLDAFIQLWLPAALETELLSEAVDQCREGANTPQELFDAIYDTISRPEIPLEVADVRIMSLHKSKGLSSPYVFVVGCVEGLLPARPDANKSPAEQAAQLEEDRRLFYVGITRVKSSLPDRAGYLGLSYPQTMVSAEAFRSQIAPVAVRQGIAHLQASRFLGEMAPHLPQPQFNTPL